MRPIIFLLTLLCASTSLAQQLFVITMADGKTKIYAMVTPQGTQIASSVVEINLAPANPNPYPAPSLAFRREAVEPLRTFSLSPQDGKAMAEMFAQQASKVKQGQLKTTVELRQSIIDQGIPLNLKGKYAGLSDAVDKALEVLMGKPEPSRNIAPTDEAAMTDMAWALWRAN